MLASYHCWLLSNFFKTTAISQMVGYRGGQAGGGGVGGEGGQTAEGGLSSPLGPFGLPISPRSASHRPNTLRGPK